MTFVEPDDLLSDTRKVMALPLVSHENEANEGLQSNRFLVPKTRIKVAPPLAGGGPGSIGSR
jgi:hypothetical protein